MPAGVFAVIVVAFETITFVAATPPIFTLLAPVKLVPEIVIEVPAVRGPDDGLTDAIVGAATYTKALALVAVPPLVVTETSFEPADPTGV